MNTTFLTAQWRKLIIANYKVDEILLKSYLPCKTKIDYWKGSCYVSLVGFMFMNTKVKGMTIPFHVNFEEVNLRFYVIHKTPEGESRRGVVFIKEIVPKPVIVFVANKIYKENYESMEMSHEWKISNDSLQISYSFGQDNRNTMSVTTGINDKAIPAGSEEEFITEHYWGYTKTSEKKTSQYAVEHPRWNVYDVKDYSINVDFGEVYGTEFEHLGKINPVSVFLAEGSCISVKQSGAIF